MTNHKGVVCVPAPLAVPNTYDTLSDKLWSGYAAYVLAHCPRFGGNYRLDEMAVELLDLAVSWEVHATF
jgi:hypothetical protein